MLGLEAPQAVKATVFGFAASATALGTIAGPVVVGAISAVSNVSVGLLTAAAAALVMAGSLTVRGREPIDRI